MNAIELMNEEHKNILRIIKVVRKVCFNIMKGTEINYKDLEEAQKKVTERKHGEQERYKRKYNIDLEDTNNYNLIIAQRNI